jgi:hypothetical protein
MANLTEALRLKLQTTLGTVHCVRLTFFILTHKSVLQETLLS